MPRFGECWLQGRLFRRRKKIVLYGNSHAEHYFEYVSILGEDFGYGVELFAAGGCGIGTKGLSQKCTYVNESFNKAKDSADIIFVAFRVDSLPRGFEELIARLIDEGHRVVVMGQPPLLKSNPAKISNCVRLNIECGVDITFDDKYPKYNEEIKKIAIRNGADFLDPFEFVSDYQKYREGNILFYSDKDHLSVYGSRWLASQFSSEGSRFFNR